MNSIDQLGTTNRKTGTGFVFLWGLGLGVACYLLAEALVPRDVLILGPGAHDILLANRLGFIFTPAVGLWLGWLQRSRRQAAIGAVVGIGIGCIYMWLCSSRNFLAIMVGFPCLLGGLLAALAGSNRSPWLSDFGIRLGKGLIAGLVLGFFYMVILNVAGGMLQTDLMTTPTQEEMTRNYIKMMWRTGPIALGISSALFFVLIRWAVGLTRVRLLVFDGVEVS